ncbi:MAG: ribonuclease P protein component [Thermoanaerobaculaceae bacterium]|nr:ribonuclease P protein component [Thermoanaerobaculaceae bacterium]
MRRSDFKRVYAGGAKVVGRYLVIFALAGDGEVRRLGITATRKIGGAVVRNRARRRIRELARSREALLEGWGGEIVVNVRRACAEVAWNALAEDFERCVKRARTAPRPPVS